MKSTRSTLARSSTNKSLGGAVRLACAGLLAVFLAAPMGEVPALASPVDATPTETAVMPGPTTASISGLATAKPSPSPSPEAMVEPTTDRSNTTQPSDADIKKYGAYMGIGAAKQTTKLAASAPPAKSRSLLAAPNTQALTSQAMPAGVPGLDVSGYQASPIGGPTSNVDWNREWNLGSRFVYAKATEGISMVDASFSSHYRGASKVGMLRGAYHFARPDQSDGATQANFFVNNGGGWSPDGRTMPPLLDMEGNPYGAACYGLSQAQMQAWIKAFSNQVAARTGRLPMIYTGYYWWKDCTGDSTAFGSQALHIAAYGTSSPLVPRGWGTYNVWQYSDSGPFAGDSNVWNGTLDRLKLFAAKADAAIPRPSIPSTADVVAIDSSGALWNYAASGSGGFKGRTQIGQGWNNLRSTNVIDWNADGVLDIVAQWTSGSVTLYKGLSAGGFAAPVTLAAAGWNGYQLTIGYWLRGSRYPQILTRADTGELKLWKNNSGGAMDGGTKIGNGWGALNLTMIDFDGDGSQDLLAQEKSGNVVLYRSNGAGGFIKEARKVVADGWNVYTSLTVASDFTSSGSTGFVRRDAAGGLSYVSVPGNSTIGVPTTIGTGWATYLIAGGENINLNHPTTPPVVKPQPNPAIRSTSDVVTTDSSGILWRYPVTNATLGTRTQIGSGFTGVKSLHVTDWNADGILDLLIQRSAGQLYLYPGNSADGFGSPITLATSGWSGYDMTVGQWIRSGKYPSIVAQTTNGTLIAFSTTNGTSLAAGTTLTQGIVRTHPVMTDFDGDSNADIAAIDNVGRMLLYRSNGQGQLIPETRKIVGTGWNAMTSVGPANAFTSAGSRGFLARTAAGAVLYYPTSSSRFGAASSVASGWAGATIAGSQLRVVQPSIGSLADVISTDADGLLWIAGGTGTGQLQPAYPVGQGWAGARTTRITDWNSDGIPDVLTQWFNGTVTIDQGLAAGGFQPHRTIGFAGWASIEYVAGKWSKSDKYPGLVGITQSGALIYWANKNGSSLSAGVQIGQGWNGLHIALTDFDGDSNQDLLASAPSGALLLYRSNGVGDILSESRRQVGTGWQGFSAVEGINGFAGANTSGLFAFSPNGDINYYSIIAGAGWGPSYTLSQKATGKTY